MKRFFKRRNGKLVDKFTIRAVRLCRVQHVGDYYLEVDFFHLGGDTNTDTVEIQYKYTTEESRMRDYELFRGALEELLELQV